LNAPTIWSYDTSTMLGCAIYCAGLAYTHRHRAHIRVDIVYNRVSLRWKAFIVVAEELLLLFPLVIVFMVVATSHAWRAWIAGEVLGTTSWYPPSGPIRTVVMLGFCLFFLQGVANFIRNAHLLIRGKHYV